ncbi:MAG: hypothetical protein LBI31_04040 [Zoogloeaceae bacterium]|jgi:mRNA-degrading endonuclease RelE of RelBE toxin-antitoxin system|nr:hypothetical protein [Zoogloeaceae bacterium]
MTVVGAGGVSFAGVIRQARFRKEYTRLDPAIQKRVDDTLVKLLQNPIPPGIKFGKLKGYSKPVIYTVHATGNFKISLEMLDGNIASLRRVAPHDDMGECP